LPENGYLFKAAMVSGPRLPVQSAAGNVGAHRVGVRVGKNAVIAAGAAGRRKPQPKLNKQLIFYKFS